MYRQVRDHKNVLINILSHLEKWYNSLETQDKKDCLYYYCRNSFNRKILTNTLTVESAALLIFLNKTGFNGLYRVNSSGLYNVPSAHRKNISLINNDNIIAVSELLSRIKIHGLL